jgi:DNA-binding SARP family transcriptional activator
LDSDWFKIDESKSSESKVAAIHISLFGRLVVRFDGQSLSGFDAGKVQEVLAYLLLSKAPQPRESLASVIWGECHTAQARKNLRQTLWQIQQNFDSQLGSDTAGIIHVDGEWIGIPSDADLWLDVGVFDQTFASVRGLPGAQMNEQQAESLQKAIELYQGDLLCNCYQDWCLVERERLQNHRLVMLSKLMEYHEHRGDFEMGIVYGNQILVCDCAREHTHRQLMRLHYLAGDRSAALRQYQRCVSTLKDELGVGPSARTQSLYNRICSDQSLQSSAESAGSNLSASQSTPADAPSDFRADALHCLKSLYSDLLQFQSKLRKSIERMEESGDK